MFFNFETFTNGLNDSTLDLLLLLAVFFAILVITSKNPVYSILFLIGLFITVSVYLIGIGLYFLGLSYLLVYVGAVSILFLFILMLINIRTSELISESRNSIFLVIITTYIFSNIIPYNIHNTISNTLYKCTSSNWDNSIVETSHIASLGNIIYTTHPLYLVITSIILLLAMVGAIIITFNNKNPGSGL